MVLPVRYLTQFGTGRFCFCFLAKMSFLRSSYQLSVRGHPETKIEVYCKMIDENFGSIVIQRRYNGYQSFNQNFYDYVYGFGDKNEEFWLGLHDLYVLTNSVLADQYYVLLVDLEDFDGNTAYASYGEFKVGEGPEYRLRFGTFYEGNAD